MTLMKGQCGVKFQIKQRIGGQNEKRISQQSLGALDAPSGAQRLPLQHIGELGVPTFAIATVVLDRITQVKERY